MVAARDTPLVRIKEVEKDFAKDNFLFLTGHHMRHSIHTDTY